MKKLNGYRLTHRNKWRLIENKILILQELALLEYYADIFDFDKKHEKYGLFEEDFTQTPIIFKCSTGTVRNWHRKLLSLGFINKTSKKHIYSLSCSDRYISAGKWGGKANHYQEIEKDQPVEIILQSFDINIQTVKEKLQYDLKTSSNKIVNKPKTDSIAIGSSKDEIRLLRSDDEYRKIREEAGYKMLTEEDMKWIDTHVKEIPGVPS